MKRTALVLVVLGLITLSLFTVKTVLLAESQSITPTPLPSHSPSFPGSDEVKLATAKFYQTYDTCLKQSSSGTETVTSEYCQSQNPYALTPIELYPPPSSSQTQLSLSIDPIMCSAIPPTGYRIADAKKREDGISVDVTTTSGESSQKIEVILQKVDAAWMVKKVTCRSS